MSEKKRKGWQGQKQERKKEGREGAKEAREEDSRFIRQVVKEWDSLWFALEARSGAVCTAEAQQTLRPRFWSPQLLPTSYFLSGTVLFSANPLATRGGEAGLLSETRRAVTSTLPRRTPQSTASPTAYSSIPRKF